MQDIRKSSEYQRWRGDVRRRDGNACRVCGVQRQYSRTSHQTFQKNTLTLPPRLTMASHSVEIVTLCLRGKEESTNLQTITEAVTKSTRPTNYAGQLRTTQR